MLKSSEPFLIAFVRSEKYWQVMEFAENGVDGFRSFFSSFELERDSMCKTWKWVYNYEYVLIAFIFTWKFTIINLSEVIKLCFSDSYDLTIKNVPSPPWHYDSCLEQPHAVAWNYALLVYAHLTNIVRKKYKEKSLTWKILFYLI